jgi:hypothetical protein
LFGLDCLPKVDKTREDIIPKECEVVTINICPITKGLEVEDLDNQVTSIKERLEKEIGKKRELQKENERLKKYV